MIFQLAGGLVSGGWDAIQNITRGIGKGASTLVSGFFPAPQRDKIISETVQAAGGSGQTYRPTETENKSMIQTWIWGNQPVPHLGSPYEEQFAIPAKVQESQQLAKSVSPEKSGDWIGEGLDWALQQTGKISTLVDELGGFWGAREVIIGTPREGYPEGQDEQHLNDLTSRIANVLNLGKAMGGEFISQVKGLFGLGYGQTQAQPGFVVQHDLQPTKQTWIGIAIVGAIIIAVIFLGRKK